MTARAGRRVFPPFGRMTYGPPSRCERRRRPAMDAFGGQVCVGWARFARRCSPCEAAMRRREFLISSYGVAVLWASPALPQTAGRVPRILWLSTESQPDPFVEGFREGLRRHGY